MCGEVRARATLREVVNECDAWGMSWFASRASIASALALVTGGAGLIGCSSDAQEREKPPIGVVKQELVTSFAATSLIIPLDVVHQDLGTLKAFGLVYKLLSNNIPVHWAIKTGKAVGDVDFSANVNDFATGLPLVLAQNYRAGAFIVDSADRALAAPIVTAWQAANTTVVHSASATFSADVRRDLVAAPRIAVFLDGNELIAFTYLNAAGIPDSTGKAWPAAAAATYPTYPDVISPAQVAGAATGGTADGALLRADGTPNWCQLTSMHYPTGAATVNSEAVREVRAWLNAGPSTHALMECEAAHSFENDTNGHFLTTAGIVDDGTQPNPNTSRVPDSTFSQFDGTFTAVNGMMDSIGLNGASTLRATDVTLINLSTAATNARIAWMTGYIDGDATKGKVSYLAGHQYPTDLPISTNAATNGVRLYMQSLFESDCSQATGQPKIAVTAAAPTIISGATTTLTITLTYTNTGTAVADSAVLTDAIPAGTTFASATGGGTFAAGTVTWNLGNIKPGASASVTFTVNIPANGTYTDQAKLAYKVSITPKSVLSNTTSTTRECLLDSHCTTAPKLKCNVAAFTCVQCASNTDCSAAAPICDTTTKACRGCTGDGECGGGTPACNTTGTFTGQCKQCSATNKTVCGGVTPSCVVATATCGCNTNSECPAATPTCNTTSHACVVGCFADADCASAVGKKCDTSGGTPGACVVCKVDSDCGGATSGTVCGAAKTCGPGCRGTGGNACPSGQVCSSTTAAIGTCSTVVPDAGTDTGTDSGSDGGTGTDTGTDTGTITDSGSDTATGDSGDAGGGDSDGDGLTDAVEKALGSDPFDADSDDDGVIDGKEIDFDKDTDGDGLINVLDPDSDNDGLFDGTEEGLDCSNPATDPKKHRCVADADTATKTDPLKKDTDGGGVSDGSEDANLNGKLDTGETDPTTGHGADDSTVVDTDKDGLSDALEKTLGSDPNDADTDDDGVTDGAEANPSDDGDGDGLNDVLDVDSDNDALYDGTEQGYDCKNPATDTKKHHCIPDADTGTTRTSSLLKDTDGGGASDGSEDSNRNGVVDAGETDPTKGHGADDGSVVDTDKDGLSDALEKTLHSNPADADTDDDGVLDGKEANPGDDRDGDGLIDVLDPDSDDDGLFDGTEVGNACADPSTDIGKKHCRPDLDTKTTTNPLLKDTDGGGMSDGSEDPNLDGKQDTGETDPTKGHGSDDASVVDTDKDGLSDALEATLGSNPKDADSDDDGLLDGLEHNPSDDTDGDGKKNVLDVDSDGDGIKDGTEDGKGCGDPATDATKGNCTADADPSTTTGGLNPDTDYGGVADGAEDTNKDGKVDTGERDPNDPADDKPIAPDAGPDGATDSGLDAGADASGTDATVDASADTGGDASDDGGTLQGGGCSCRASVGTDSTPETGILALSALVGLVFVRRRRASRRDVVTGD